jgi:hypothetical protein
VQGSENLAATGIPTSFAPFAIGAGGGSGSWLWHGLHLTNRGWTVIAPVLAPTVLEFNLIQAYPYVHNNYREI